MLVYRKIDCLVTNGNLLKNCVQPQEKELGIIRNAALVFSRSKGVVWVGKDSVLPAIFKKKKQIICKGHVAYPGFVDSHTHPVFDGNRAKEFALRTAGASYQEIAQAGGGILSTVSATRKASVKKLSQLVQTRLETAYDFGVRAMEGKSGYGLEKSAELRSLSALQSAEKSFKKIKVLRTCLAAHAVPPEYKNKKEKWVDVICKSILPGVRKRNLASFVDVFCDEGYFSISDTRKIFTTAKSLGFSLRLHGDELANTEAACLAVEMGAKSVDHLLKVSPAGIRALAQSDTIATLLPGTSLFLKEPPAPARELIDGGAAVALATDFNPGTCTTQNLPFIASLATLQLGMTVPEVIIGITWNGACALGIQDMYGALKVGYRGEPVFCKGDHPSAICYHLASGKLVRFS